jgi:hypothetical protein
MATRQDRETEEDHQESQLDRRRDPENGAVRLETVSRAARVIGKKIRLRLVDAA